MANPIKPLQLILIVAISMIILTNAYALRYEEKPNITAYIAGSNYLDRGDQIINIVVYNSAERKKVHYFDEEESSFFSQNENMLFTAYNVEIELLDNEYIKVRTPVQSIPALQPFQPVNLMFFVKVLDNASAGEYKLNLRVKFDIIYDLSYLDMYTPRLVPVKKTVQNGNETVEYEYASKVEKYKIKYKTIEYIIPLTVYIKEKDVRIEIVSITTENMIGKGKGKITVKIRNIGEKTAKNAYLILETPFKRKSAVSGLKYMQMVPSSVPAQMLAGQQMPVSAAVMPSQTVSSTAISQASYYIGDLEPDETVDATFYVNVDTKDEGVYPFKVKAIYLDEYGNVKESNEVSFGVYVARAPDFIVKSVKSTVFVNSKGTLEVLFTPTVDLKDVSVYLRTEQPISALSAEYYVGDVKANREYTAVFKIKSSKEAKPVEYPAELIFKYKSLNEYFESDPVRIGIKVHPKMRFEVHTSSPPKIEAGKEGIVTFIIKNTGNFTIRDAIARLTIVDPFSSTDDTAYIGTLRPNESAVIRFKLKVDSDATPKVYGLNLEVKYRDPEDEWVVSEPIKVAVEVTKPKIPYGLMAIALVIIAVIGAIVYRRYRR